MNSKEPVTIINNNFKTYLIGSMESPGKDDGGVGWRQVLTPLLNQRGIYVFDPTKEEAQKVGCSAEEIGQKLTGWQLGGHWDLFMETMAKIWRGVTKIEEDPETGEPRVIHIMGDIDYVDNSDFLIWYLNDGDRLGGTIAELVMAWIRGIPCYLITTVPKSKINKSILFFLLDSGHGKGRVFKNDGELLSFLDGEYKLNRVDD